MLMVQAGAATDAVIEEFAPPLQPGDTIIGGGNAHFADARRREAALREAGVHFVGAGVSDGEEGALHGPSVMVSGSAESYAALGPMFETISAHVDGEPCAAHIGANGAGHFVKMVHNGIGYADMQLIAEAYALPRKVAGHTPAEIAGLFRTWNTGRLDSYPMEITAEVFAHTDPDSGKAFVDVVADAAGQKGTGRWTVQTALGLGSPATVIAQATFARAASARQQLRAAYRGLPGGTTPPLTRSEADRFASQVEHALYASQVIAYDQGWTMIQDAATEYDWDIDLAAVARIWRGGCVIRAAFLDRIRAAYTTEPDLAGLLAQGEFATEIADAQVPWRETVASAVRRGIPVPACSSARAHHDTLRAERLPAVLLQGQRATTSASTPTSAPTGPAPSTPPGPNPGAPRPAHRRDPPPTPHLRKAMPMAKQVQFDRLGGPEVLTLREVPTPVPGAGEVLIRVDAIGLNRAEIVYREGGYFYQPVFPSTLGYEAAGAVEAIGTDVGGFAAGDPVSVVPAFLQTDYGTYGDHVLVPASAVVPRPADIDPVKAAAVWMAYVTAYGGIAENGFVRPGDHVLITAASSSVGLAAIQTAHRIGAVPIATTRGAHKKQALLDAGAAHVIVTDDEDLPARVKEITSGEGVRLAFDPIAGPGVETIAQGIAPGGHLTVYGALDTRTTPLPNARLFPALSTSTYILFEVTTDAERLRRAVAFVNAGLRDGSLDPVVDRTFDLADIADAHRHMASNTQVGKIVVTVRHDEA